MAATYSDQDIDALLREGKRLPEDFRVRLQMRQKRGHKERELEVDGTGGNRFRIVLRQSDHNALDFSVILAVLPSNTKQQFRLRRYNGKHEHTNLIEGVRFYGFHIHMATERYQESGTREDAYAEPTERYSDLHGALSCMLEDCGFEAPETRQQTLFEEV